MDRKQPALLARGLVVVAALMLVVRETAALPETFDPGSLIIPMDVSAGGQDLGMLRAYGLVYELLRNGVPVHWVINPTKLPNGDDFVIGTGLLENVETGATVSLPRPYRGGPFVIAAADAGAALPIIQAWQAAAGDNTVVHRLAAGAFTAESARTLLGAPRIAILKDGSETIAFIDLNAAGILDSTGAAWSASSPDLLTEAQVGGATGTNDADGALFHASGLTRYGHLLSMHYQVTSNTPGVVQEVRSWLDQGPLTHAFMQCEAARVFENDPAGHFLTTAGIIDDGAAASSPANRVPFSPLTQIDGTLQADDGVFDSLGLPGGSSYKVGVTSLINETSAPLTGRVMLLTGHLDGNLDNGRVTYLSGHDYTTTLPVTTNPQANGVRLFLNTLFESGSVTEPVQDDVTLTTSAPAFISTSQITYTISYANPGPRPVENVKVTDVIPPGTTYVSATGGGTHSGGVVTWNLPPLAAGASGALSLTVNATADGVYSNTAKMDFAHLQVRRISSATVTTARDTIAPIVTIVNAPIATAATSPTFFFTVASGGTATSAECRVDSGPFVPCASSFTTLPLANGNHVFYVRATDAAGNVGPVASHAFEVDTIAPIVAIPGPPINPTVTADSTPTLSFSISAAGSPAIAYCAVTSVALPQAPFVPCGAGSYTVVSPLSDGSYVFRVQAIDAAGNVGTASFSFVVNTTPPADVCPAAPVLDTFNRANGHLGSKWAGAAVDLFYKIKNQKAEVGLGGPAYWNTASFGVAQTAFVTLSTVDRTSRSQGVLLKVQTGSVPNAGAIAVVYDGPERAVRVSTIRLGALAWKPYTQTPVTFVNGDKLTASVTASGVVKVYKNCALIATVTLTGADASFFNPRGGKIGIWTLDASKAVLDDFGGGTIP